MLYEILVRTYLWIYWFCEYHILLECEIGDPHDADPFFELRISLETLLGIDPWYYDYCIYENF